MRCLEGRRVGGLGGDVLGIDVVGSGGWIDVVGLGGRMVEGLGFMVLERVGRDAVAGGCEVRVEGFGEGFGIESSDGFHGSERRVFLAADGEALGVDCSWTWVSSVRSMTGRGGRA